MFRPLFFFVAATTLAIGLNLIDVPTSATEPVTLSGDGIVRVQSPIPWTRRSRG